MTANQLRLDPLTGRWVVVAEDRRYRPAAFRLSPGTLPSEGAAPCPFCPGNEEATPPALVTYGPTGSWQVRVVPNLYPAFTGDEPMVSHTHGPVHTQAPSSGIHEVLIISPNHNSDWASLAPEDSNMIMAAIRDRMAEHSHSRTIRYSQVLVNHGRDAGASMAHPHAQLIGIPFIPRELTDELAGFSRFVGGCLMCTTLAMEESLGHRVITSDDNAVVIAPYWSASPFEMLVVPRQHGPHLHLSDPDTLFGTGTAILQALGTLREHVGSVAYNVVFHSAPYRTFGSFHWHAHIYPKLTTQAGFELGTGVPINIVSPETVTDVLSGKVVEAVC